MASTASEIELGIQDIASQILQETQRIQTGRDTIQKAVTGLRNLELKYTQMMVDVAAGAGTNSSLAAQKLRLDPLVTEFAALSDVANRLKLAMDGVS